MSLEEPNKIADTRNGPLIFNMHDQRVGRSLDTYGEWAESELSVFRQILRPGDTAVDVGAHIGVQTVSFAKMVGPTGRVFSLEPQRIMFQLLCANVQLNSLLNVGTFQVCAGSAMGQAVVPHIDYRKPGDFAAFVPGNYQQGDRVPVVPLDDMPLSACRLLKIDVEGAELPVLQGARKLLEKHRPVVFVENNETSTPSALIELLSTLDYRLFWHLDFYFNKENFKGVANDIFEGAFDVNLLAVPKAIDLKITNFTPVENADDTWQKALQRA